MSMGNPSLADNVLIYGAVPGIVNDGTLTTGWMPLTNVIRLWGIVLGGVTDAVIDAAIMQATDSSGTGAKALSKPAALTQIAADGDGTWHTFDVEVDAATFDADNAFSHAALVITAGAGTVGANVSGVLLGWVRHRPPTQPVTYGQEVVVAG